MGYLKQLWTDAVSVLSAARFNHQEDGIEKAEQILIIPNITVDTGVVAGDPIAFDGTKYIKTANTRYIYDGSDAIRLGTIPRTSDAGDIGFTLFVQADGSLGTGITSVPAGQVLSTTEFFVDFNTANTNPKEYNGILVGFKAISGDAGEVKIKIQFAVDTDKVDLRYKTSAWAGGDTIATGTAIATLTSDSGYYGDNNWYIATITGASDGDTIYIKGFPYKGAVYNVEIGENETITEVGSLEGEWTADDLSSMVINDTSDGANNLTTNNATFSGAIVGDGADFTNGYGSFGSEININGKYLCFVIDYDGSDSALFGHSSRKHPEGRIVSDVLKVGGRNGGGTTHIYAEYTLSAGNSYLVTVKFTSTGVELYIDDAETPVTATVAVETLTINYMARCNVGNTGDSFVNGNAMFDQIRLFNALSYEARQELYNGGLIC